MQLTNLTAPITMIDNCNEGTPMLKRHVSLHDICTYFYFCKNNKGEKRVEREGKIDIKLVTDKARELLDY